MLFLQAFRQIANVKGSRLRSLEKGFHVEFQGEGAEDAGGPCMKENFLKKIEYLIFSNNI